MKPVEYKKVIVPGAIYPGYDDLEWKKELKKFDIDLKFLLDDGIEFTYPETLEPWECPGNLSFFDAKTKSRVLTYVENFGKIQFFGPTSEEDPILEITIYDELYDSELG